MRQETGQMVWLRHPFGKFRIGRPCMDTLQVEGPVTGFCCASSGDISLLCGVTWLCEITFGSFRRALSCQKFERLTLWRLTPCSMGSASTMVHGTSANALATGIPVRSFRPLYYCTPHGQQMPCLRALSRRWRRRRRRMHWCHNHLML